MFHVGQLVVCINDDWVPDVGAVPHPIGLPRRGSIYEVDGVEQMGRDLFLYLAEFPPFAYRDYRKSIFFGSSAFRLVQHDRIAVFTALLKPSSTSIGQNENA